MGTFGKPQSWVLAEDETLARIGWNPFHVEKGFSRDVSTVAAANSTIWGRTSSRPRPIPNGSCSSWLTGLPTARCSRAA